MIETFFSLGTLTTTQAFFVAFLVGIGFGFALEQGGFGSSRRLAGIFYFRDMTVLKVMFSAIITALLGLSYLSAFGIVNLENVFLMPTYYGAQIVGGLIFGVGFVVGCWCPGTAAVGLAAGRVDAAVFLAGAIGGSILFNELFSWDFLKKLYTQGESGVLFVYDSLGLSKTSFVFLFTFIAVVCFWGAEYIEKKRSGTGEYWNTKFLRAFTVSLLILAAGLFVVSGDFGLMPKTAPSVPMEKQILSAVEAGEDHIEPEDLADRMIKNDPGLLVVDVRPALEYQQFHLPGAINIPLPDLSHGLSNYRDKTTIVLYSNGMTHPAQARDSLTREGYRNVYILTDGLKGFIERCLKPASLRPEPVSSQMAAQIQTWRQFFTSQSDLSLPTSKSEAVAMKQNIAGGLVETAWLFENLQNEEVKIIDCREQPLYNAGHIPGAIFISVEAFRGVVDSVPSMLLPSPMLAAQFSLLGIRPADTVVLVPDDKIHNATLISMALLRLGHKKYAILNGGMGKWLDEKRLVDTTLPGVKPSHYPADVGEDGFTVGVQAVLDAMKNKEIILDVRPKEFFTGEKIEEARGGHIPGAINRPYTQDIQKTPNYAAFKSLEDLAQAYAAIIPSKETPVIVHCRTGHQASHTFFILQSLLGYKNVRWYDAGWTEWSTKKELPVAQGDQ